MRGSSESAARIPIHHVIFVDLLSALKNPIYDWIVMIASSTAERVRVKLFFEIGLATKICESIRYCDYQLQRTGWTRHWRTRELCEQYAEMRAIAAQVRYIRIPIDLCRNWKPLSNGYVIMVFTSLESTIVLRFSYLELKDGVKLHFTQGNFDACAWNPDSWMGPGSRLG